MALCASWLEALATMSTTPLRTAQAALGVLDGPAKTGWADDAEELWHVGCVGPSLLAPGVRGHHDGIS